MYKKEMVKKYDRNDTAAVLVIESVTEHLCRKT